MTDLKPNAELGYAVLDQIDAHPELWSQDWWFSVTDCGTVACFAGWACLISGDKATSNGRPLYMVAVGEDLSYVQQPNGEVVYVHDRALELLGLDREEARKLFSASNNRAGLGRHVEEIFGPRPAVTP